MQQLDPAIKTIWSIQLLIRTIIFTALAVVYEIVSRKAQGFPPVLPFGLPTISVFALGLISAVVVPILRYRYWAFQVRPDELYVERGIFTRVRTLAPVVRIQHLDVSQNLFENWLGLGKLVVYTAGTRGADIVIPGLPYEYAEALRDRLKNYSSEDAV